MLQECTVIGQYGRNVLGLVEVGSQQEHVGKLLNNSIRYGF